MGLVLSEAESESDSGPIEESDQQFLLSSAAEIVARQRLAEELEENSTRPTEIDPEPSRAISRENGSRRPPRRSAQIVSNTPRSDRSISTISELLENLFENNEVRPSN